jgi:hypothetical protein
MDLHIIFTDTDVIISKKFYPSWRDIQDEYLNYKTSLGAWSVKKVIDFLETEYQNLEPDAAIQVDELKRSADQTAMVSFNISLFPASE